MRVFLSAGEASGDAYGAALVREITRLSPSPLTFEGIGGTRMRWAGVSLVADSSKWGAISVVEGVKLGLRILGSILQARKALLSGEPGLFVPIDFGFANIRLSRWAKARGWKVLYFVPPGSWRRDRQGRDLPQLADAIATPFEWSAELLNEMGAPAHWFGHPIKQLLYLAPSEVEAVRERIAVLPGSRAHEIDANLPLIASVLGGSSEVVEFALAPSVDSIQFQKDWAALAPDRRNDVFTSGDTYGVLRRARVALVCSGTATLEAALCRCPMVVIYRVSKTMEMEARILRFKIPEFVSLPNILLRRRAVPEFVQLDALPVPVREALESVKAEGPVREAQLAAFEELTTILGPDDAITKTAELALTLIRR